MKKLSLSKTSLEPILPTGRPGRRTGPGLESGSEVSYGTNRNAGPAEKLLNEAFPVPNGRSAVCRIALLGRVDIMNHQAPDAELESRSGVSVFRNELP